MPSSEWSHGKEGAAEFIVMTVEAVLGALDLLLLVDGLSEHCLAPTTIRGPLPHCTAKKHACYRNSFPVFLLMSVLTAIPMSMLPSTLMCIDKFELGPIGYISTHMPVHMFVCMSTT